MNSCTWHIVSRKQYLQSRSHQDCRCDCCICHTGSGKIIPFHTCNCFFLSFFNCMCIQCVSWEYHAHSVPYTMYDTVTTIHMSKLQIFCVVLTCMFYSCTYLCKLEMADLCQNYILKVLLHFIRSALVLNVYVNDDASVRVPTQLI